ncbi:MAG: hypothetical protein ACXVY8_01205 [Gaiellaceae bacterium]
MSILLVALLTIAAGCGSKKKAASTTTAATTTEATTTTSAATTTTSKGTPSFVSAKNCLQMAGLASQISKAVQSSSGNASSTAEAELKGLQALAAAAPSEIKGDFQTFADAFGAYAQAIAKSGYKVGSTPTPAQLATLEKAIKPLTSAKLQAAEQHLSAWSQKNCAGVKAGG